MFSRRNIKNFGDLELVHKFQDTGNRDYVGELFRRYTRFVFLVSMKYLKDEESAKDMSMLIFEKLINELGKHEIRNFKSWLHSVTRNSCLMKIRSEKDTITVEKSIREFVDYDQDQHLTDREDKELNLQKLDDAILSLKKEQRICIELFYLKERSYEEVADETGYELKQVKSYIQNGKRNLKIILNK